MKDVMILTPDESLFSVIFCELIWLGYSVEELEGGACRVLFADADSANADIKKVRYKKLVLISREPKKIDRSGAAAVLSRPIKASELREVAASLLCGVEKKLPVRAERSEKISVDRTERTVFIGTKKVNLSEKEFRIFTVLLENRRSAVSREALAAAIGGGEGNEVDVYICYLRRKLEAGGKRLIFTKRGVGYFLK